MMDKVYIGKVVTTHGIKGEIRILSDFKYKDKAFCIGNELIINNDILHIKSYRIHKGYDMVSFKENMVKLISQLNPQSTGLDDKHMHMAINILNRKKI